MDELGLPVPQPSKVPAYLFLAASVVCVGVNVGTWIYAANTRPDWSRPVVIAAGVISMLPLIGTLNSSLSTSRRCSAFGLRWSW